MSWGQYLPNLPDHKTYPDTCLQFRLANSLPKLLIQQVSGRGVTIFFFKQTLQMIPDFRQTWKTLLRSSKYLNWILDSLEIYLKYGSINLTPILHDQIIILGDVCVNAQACSGNLAIVVPGPKINNNPCPTASRLPPWEFGLGRAPLAMIGNKSLTHCLTYDWHGTECFLPWKSGSSK